MKQTLTRIFVATLAATTLATSAYAAAQPMQYDIDPAHSSVSFKIRHLVSKTQGSFSDFEGVIAYDPQKPEKSTVTATIKTASINTANEKRDTHLRSPDFFNVEKNPTMKFVTTKLIKVSKDGKTGELVGKLTLNGVTKPVTLNVEMTGKTKDPFTGKDKIGFTGTTKINRQDFNIKWNLDDKQGGAVLGDDVEITLEIEATAKG